MAEAGDTLMIDITIENLGVTLAGAPLVGFYLSTDSTIDAGDVFLDSLRMPTPIPGSGTRSADISSDIPTGTTAGTYYLIARVDENDEEMESNEQNNLGFTTISVVDQPVSVTTNAQSIAEVFPVPAKDMLNVHFGNTGELPEFITLFNHSGAVIMKRPTLGTTRHEIDLSALPKGMYYLRAGEQVKVIPLVD